ncbi:MAG TPA: hypothetical protein ENK18_24835 [Deltaproteobacteria bacterium]|nr:hypothetical protein [Deltaproteobacteria bacterium]
MSSDPSSVPLQLGLPLGIAFVIGTSWLLLYTSRRYLGWPLLVAVIVALHVLPITLGGRLELEPGPGLAADPGWLATTAWPLLALMVHIREGTHRTRELALAVLAGSLAVACVAGGLSDDVLSVLIRGISRGLLAFTSAATALAVWEILGRMRTSVPLRVGGAMLLALAVDATGQGCVDALLRGDAFEIHVLGTLTVAVVAASMHTAIGTLWLLVLEGDRWYRSANDRPLLDVLSVMLGTRHYVPLRPDVVRDGVSGLYHRTFLEDRAAVELERAEHLAASVALIVLDARDDPDRVGRALLSSVRLTDLSCRWSDNRYVSLLPGADRAAARTSARRAVDGFRGEAAVGIAVFPHDGDTLEELVEVARHRTRPVPRL